MCNPRIQPRRSRVLLVEDEPTIAVTLRDELEDAGLDVVVDEDGARAIARLQREPFDCVVTDLRLPGADGSAVLAAAKARDPRVEVFVVTAHATPDHAARILELGATALVEKPFCNAALVERIGHRLRRPAG